MRYLVRVSLMVCVLGAVLVADREVKDVIAQDRSSDFDVVLDDSTRTRVFEDVACIVMDVEGGSSLTRGNTRIRSSLKKGHVIFKGDSINLSYQAKLSLSFDPTAYDVIQFEGPTVIQFVDTTRIEMTHGKVFATLDNAKPVRLFTIKTPGAIASTRDAHFFIEIKHQGAEIHSYKSKVKVYGVTPAGEERNPGVTVEAGQKTSVTSLGKLPTSPPQNLTAGDLRNKSKVQRLRSIASGWLNDTKEKWLEENFDQKSDAPPTSPGKYTPSNTDWSGGDKEKSKVLF